MFLDVLYHIMHVYIASVVNNHETSIAMMHVHSWNKDRLMESIRCTTVMAVAILLRYFCVPLTHLPLDKMAAIADDIFKRIFMKEKFCISKFVLKVPIAGCIEIQAINSQRNTETLVMLKSISFYDPSHYLEPTFKKLCDWELWASCDYFVVSTIGY